MMTTFPVNLKCRSITCFRFKAAISSGSTVPTIRLARSLVFRSQKKEWIVKESASGSPCAIGTEPFFSFKKSSFHSAWS